MRRLKSEKKDLRRVVRDATRAELVAIIIDPQIPDTFTRMALSELSRRGKARRRVKQ